MEHALDAWHSMGYFEGFFVYGVDCWIVLGEVKNRPKNGEKGGL